MRGRGHRSEEVESERERGQLVQDGSRQEYFWYLTVS
jgi:hypothetical protein